MNIYKKTSLALFALMLIGMGVPLAAAQSTGIQYQYSAGIVSLETDDIAIKVTGNDQAPHFHWWDPNTPDVDYHVMFVRMFEANDTNANGIFDNDTDVMIGAPFVLPTVGWDFSGFETVEDDGNITEVHFNFTTEATFDPRPEGTGMDYGNLPSLPEFDVNVSVNVHMYLENPGEFKFDLVVEGWSWTYEESILVLMFTVTESAHGQNQGDIDPSGFHKVGTKFQFENGYFGYNETALAANNTLQVRASFGEAPGEYSGNAVYLSFENFGDDTLEYDPVLGVVPSEPGLVLDPMTLGIVAGAAIIVILAIALIRRK
ncbi:MAG: hypothetical protein AM325_015335 [Candidatus Thorarchaeota archaeon SMTZ1-45]